MHIMKNKKPLVLALALAGLTAAALPAQADFIRSVSFPKDTAITGSDNRYYSLYIPSGYNAAQKTPMVVTLHGCRQSDLAMVDKSNMHLEAERDNFIVLYPFMNSSTDPAVGGVNDDDMRNPNCWGYWFDAERVRGKGEVADIKRMVDKIKTQYNIDADRVHITGISSGGAMANIAQVAYPDVFASSVIIEGIAYKETSATYTGTQDCALILNKTVDATNRAASAIITDMRAEMGKSVLRQAPVMVIHNEKDCTVPISVGKNLAATWAGLLGTEGKALNLSAPTSVTQSPAGEFKWTHSKYGVGANGETLLETFYLNVSESDVVGAGVQVLTKDTYAPGSDSAVAEDTKKGHWWSGGGRGPWMINAGPSTSAIAWNFLKNHPMKGTVGPQAPIITPFAAESGTTCGTITGKATDADGDLDRVEIRVDTGTWQTVSLLADGSFQTQVCPANGSHTVEARAFDKRPSTSATVSASFTIGTNPVKVGNKVWNQITNTTTLGKLQNAYYYWPEAIPTAKMKNGKRALMLSLHGCSQTAQGHVISKGYNWESTAEEYGMVVLAPTKPDSTKYPRSGTGQYSGTECWDWFDANHDRTGRDAGALIKLVQDVIANPDLSIDKDQVYVSGLSGGSGEAVVLGCIAPDVFRGIAVVETVTLGSPGTAGSSPKTPTEISNLCKQLAGSYSVEFKKQIAAVACGDKSGYKPFCDNQMGGYKEIYGATTCTAATTVPGGSAGGGQDTRCKNTTTGQAVSSLLIPGMDHAWPAGTGGSKNGAYGTWIDNTRVNFPNFATKFLFENNPLVILPPEPKPPVVTCDKPGSAPTNPVAIQCNATDDGAVTSIALTLSKTDGTFTTTENYAGTNFNVNLTLDVGKQYNLTAVATDNDNMKSVPYSTTFVVQAQPTDSAPVIGTVTPSATGACLKATGTVSDDKGLASVLVSVKKSTDTAFTDQGNATIGAVSSGNYPVTWEKCGFAAGTYTIKLKATDTLPQSVEKILTPNVTVSAPTDCFLDTNANHVTALRAYNSFGAVYAYGSYNYLGLYSSTTKTSLKKSVNATTGLTTWTKVTSCQ